MPGPPVAAGETFTGNVLFVTHDQTPIPSLSELRRAPAVPGRLPADALAGVSMLGFGFRRKTRRRLLLTIIALSAFAAATAVPYGKTSRSRGEPTSTPSRRIAESRGMRRRGQP